jgi:hypothetical protein
MQRTKRSRMRKRNFLRLSGSRMKKESCRQPPGLQNLKKAIKGRTSLLFMRKQMKDEMKLKKKIQLTKRNESSNLDLLRRPPPQQELVPEVTLRWEELTHALRDLRMMLASLPCSVRGHSGNLPFWHFSSVFPSLFRRFSLSGTFPVSLRYRCDFLFIRMISLESSGLESWRSVSLSQSHFP